MIRCSGVTGTFISYTIILNWKFIGDFKSNIVVYLKCVSEPGKGKLISYTMYYCYNSTQNLISWQKNQSLCFFSTLPRVWLKNCQRFCHSQIFIEELNYRGFAYHGSFIYKVGYFLGYNMKPSIATLIYSLKIKLIKLK